MNYLADLWVDVIAKRIAKAAQVWLDKELQDVQLGQRNPWVSQADSQQEMERKCNSMSES